MGDVPAQEWAIRQVSSLFESLCLRYVYVLNSVTSVITSSSTQACTHCNLRQSKNWRFFQKSNSPTCNSEFD